MCWFMILIKVNKEEVRQVELAELLDNADVISFHVHVTDETLRMVNIDWFLNEAGYPLIVPPVAISLKNLICSCFCNRIQMHFTQQMFFLKKLKIKLLITSSKRP